MTPANSNRMDFSFVQVEFMHELTTDLCINIYTFTLIVEFECM